MRASIRDAIATGILVAAVGVVWIAWRPLGPWAALGIVFAAAIAVIATYRLDPSASPLPRGGAPREPVLLRDR